MTTKKPRKMWILTTPAGDSLFYADEPMNHDWGCCSKTLYLEVLPEPTDAELMEMDENCGHSWEAGFRAALEWMKNGKA